MTTLPRSPWSWAPANLVRREDHASRFFTAPGRHNDPVANMEIISVGSEVVDAPGIPKPNADDTLRRRGIVETEDGVTVAAAAFADLLARFAVGS